MGSIIGTVLAILLMVFVIMTAVTEPKLSFEYGKAMALSGKVFFECVRDMVTGHKEVKAVKDVR